MIDGWRWSLQCTLEQALLLSDALSELEKPKSTAVSIYEQSPGIHIVDAYYPARPVRHEIAAVFAAIGLETPSLDSAEIAPIEKTNWVARSQTNLPPVKAGRFIVHGRHDREKADCRSRTSIEIDAAEAFGTAHHGTTRSCLRALDILLRKTKPRNVLDLGTGTGILAIAVAKALRDANILATDNDPVACRTALSNCNLNLVLRRIKIIQAEGFNHPLLRTAQTFDTVIANILAGTLKNLAANFRIALKANGHAILSGIMTEQAASVRATFRSHGFIDCRQLDDGEWTTLVMQKNP